MKVNASEYIKSHKDLLRQLLNQLLEIYPYASILAVDAQAFDYRVTKTTTMMSEMIYCLIGVLLLKCMTDSHMVNILLMS